ncbi:hypothetical protein WJX75_002583 [Coccomyxa subellipsoidea]|uniref:Helicase-associated domain-containing protein n=1 Tax=Coccomyxa subellipsoidea TaxID=248742 RepID=A0ABR2YCT8_9CHLO
MSPRSSANPAVSRISSSSVAEQPGSRKQQPVQLSDVVRALDFDWDEIGSEESDTASNQQRAHSGLSASTSEIMSSGTGYKSAKKWRAPSEGVDDRWYSLSPHFVDSKLPEWKQWRLRNRSAPLDQPLSESFKERLEALRRYKEEWGDCLVPRRYWGDWRLGEWVADARQAHKEKRLTPAQVAALEHLGFPWKVPQPLAEWEYMMHELRRFRLEFNLDAPAFKWRDPNADFSNQLSKWYHQQPDRFKQRMLSPDQVRKLKKAGYDLRTATGDDISEEDYAREHEGAQEGTTDFEFETMYKELKAWRDAYNTTIVPKQVWDAPLLGAWVHKMRKVHKEVRLPGWQVAKLDKLVFAWKMEQQSAKWHHNLHEARRFKEAHGHALIPAGYTNAREPGWMEASRWVTRNAKLFSKGKLTDKRYQLIRDILGIKFVKKIGGPNRKGVGREIPADAKPLGPWNKSLRNPTGGPRRLEGHLRKKVAAVY